MAAVSTGQIFDPNGSMALDNMKSNWVVVLEWTATQEDGMDDWHLRHTGINLTFCRKKVVGDKEGYIPKLSMEHARSPRSTARKFMCDECITQFRTLVEAGWVYTYLSKRRSEAAAR